MGAYLAFDLGASSGRAIIGRLAEGKLTLQEVHRFPNGPVSKDGSFYWDYPALCTELRAGLKKALAVEKKLDGIAIDTWGVDYVLFDRTTGAMKRLPYNYRDTRTAAAAEKVWQILPKEQIYQRTGIQCMTLNTLYQLYAHKMEHPEELENAYFLPIPDALGMALGGEAKAEYTHCSTMDLLDPVKRDWDWELIAKLGLPRSIFPEIVPACSANGVLSAELQKELGCGPIPLWKCGSHDTASAVAAVPAPDSGSWAYLSAGTWALLGAEIGAPMVTAEAGKASFTNEGGLDGTIRFLSNIMGSWLFQETRRCWNEAGKKLSFADMENMARAAEGGKYLINPNCADFATPGDMPGRIRTFCSRTGQAANMTDAEVVRAIYDSLALCIAGKLEQMEKLLPETCSTLNVVGGGTKDGFLMELAAAASHRTVLAGPVEATAVGNVLAQAIACGEIAGLKAARKVVRASFDVREYAPDAAAAAMFDAVRNKFRGLCR